jgi:uncharacterized protein (TIGR03437 family)
VIDMRIWLVSLWLSLISAASAANLTSFVFSNRLPSASNCTAPAAVTSVSVNDSYFVAWFSFSGVKAGDSLTVQWYSPDGNPFGSPSSTSYTSPGDYCRYSYWSLDSSFSKLAGVWRFRVTYNGQPFIDRTVALSGSATHKPRVLDSLVLTNSPATAQCASPNSVVSFVDTDPSMSIWYSFSNGYAGDVTKLDWYDPSGNFISTSSTSPLPSDGSYCSYSTLGLTSSTARKFGNWRVVATYNGNSFFTATVPLNDSRLLNVPYRLTINQEDFSHCPADSLTVSVTDALGNAVTGLKDADFVLTENGTPIPVQATPISNSGLDLSLAIVIDSSGSLSDSDLSLEKAAAKQLISLVGRSDAIAVYSFTEKVVLQQDFTTDRNLANQGVAAISDRGGTAIYDALSQAASALKIRGTRRAIVLMTDGDDNASHISESDAIAAARQAGVPIFTVGFGERNDQVLTQIAQQTGAFYSSTSNSPDLQRILTALGKALTGQYLVTYRSANPSVQQNIVLQVKTSGGASNTYTFTGIPACSVSGTTTFYANPNPIQLAPGRNSGQTQLFWTTTSNIKAVDIRIFSPDGTLINLSPLPPSGNLYTIDDIRDGTTFYLQDASSGSSAGAAKTVAPPLVVKASPTQGGPVSLTASPSPVTFCSDPKWGRTVLNWSAPGYSTVYLRQNSATGPIAKTGGSSGSLVLNQATDGMKFVLTDELGNVLAVATVSVLCQVPTSITIPAARVGQLYSYRLSITAGVGPYGWGLSYDLPTSTPLPDGLTLEDDGQIHGTPLVYKDTPYLLRLFVQDAGEEGHPSAVVLVSLTIQPPTSTLPAPSFPASGVVSNASGQQFLTSGNIATIYGSNLAGGTYSATTVPLPLILGGVRVTVNGIDAPLFFVSPTQINFQMPWEAPSSGTVPVVVYRDGVPSSTGNIPVGDSAPAIYVYPRTSSILDPIITHQNGNLVTPSNPARPNEFLTIWGTGLGSVTNPPRTGYPASTTVLSNSVTMPVITLGSSTLQVSFSGLAPGFIGLAMFNVRMPASFAQSGMLPLQIRMGSRGSQIVNVSVAP